MKRTDAGVLKRLLLIAAVSTVIIAVAVVQGRAIVSRGRAAYAPRAGVPLLELLPDSTFVRSYPIVFNGAEAQFSQYRSPLPADEVVRRYRAEPADAGGPGERLATPMLSSAGSGCSVLSYGTREGRVVGIVAFDNVEFGGSDYFIGSMPLDADSPGPDGDCAGREPPGVPRPPRATRVLCIENLAGLDSVLAFYEAWGRPSGLVEDVRAEMGEHGWAERAESSATLTEHYAGHALLSFSRGREQCLVAVDQAPKTGKIVVVVFWAERPWLPEGTAL